MVISLDMELVADDSGQKSLTLINLFLLTSLFLSSIKTLSTLLNRYSCSLHLEIREQREALCVLAQIVNNHSYVTR